MIGGAGKKISTIVELAEELYERVNDLRARMESMSETVDGTADRVEAVEAELAEQRALIEAIAEEQGVDVEAVRESATTADAGTAAVGADAGGADPSGTDGAEASDADENEE